jgi:chitin disaccharide deacetylase
MAGIAVIINADDLGISQQVNDATFDLMSKGRISSATIIANAPATREAARLAARFRKCSFGVHLNLTEFEPLTGGAARLLVDCGGRMTRSNETALPRPGRLAAAFREMCAQVERVASLGVRISHLDSHNHVHTRPFFFPVLKEVQRRYQIRRVRLTKNFYSPEQPCPTPLWWKKHAFNRALRSVFGTHTTEAFTEFLTYYHAPMARQQSVRQIELMVHPGAQEAKDETPILDSDWIARTGLPLQLISFAELPQSRLDAVGRSARSGKELRPCE